MVFLEGRKDPLDVPRPLEWVFFLGRGMGFEWGPAEVLWGEGSGNSGVEDGEGAVDGVGAWAPGGGGAVLGGLAWVCGHTEEERGCVGSSHSNMGHRRVIEVV